MTTYGDDCNSHPEDTFIRVYHDTQVEQSFEFLLAREPKTSIRSEFDLAVISRYFSDYVQQMKRELGLNDGKTSKLFTSLPHDESTCLD